MAAETLTIESVMNKSPHSIGVDQTLAVAKKMLAEHGFRHLPVRKGGELVGVITDRDINFALSVEKIEADEIKVEDAFTREPYIVSPTTSVAEVAQRMARDHLGCTLVVDHGKLVGIFTTTDACATLAEILSARVVQ